MRADSPQKLARICRKILFCESRKKWKNFTPHQQNSNAQGYHLTKASDIPTLLLHPNFPEKCFDGSSVPKEFWLRHELAHIKFGDDLVGPNGRFLAKSVALAVSVLMYGVLTQIGVPALIAGGVCVAPFSLFTILFLFS